MQYVLDWGEVFRLNTAILTISRLKRDRSLTNSKQNARSKWKSFMLTLSTKDRVYLIKNVMDGRNICISSCEMYQLYKGVSVCVSNKYSKLENTD